MTEMSTKEIVMMIKNDLDRLADKNAKDHEAICERIANDKLKFEIFKTEVTTKAGVIGAIAGVVITVIGYVIKVVM